MTEKVKQEDGIVFFWGQNSLIPHEIDYCLAVYLTERGLSF